MLDTLAPDFTLPATGDQTLTLSAFKGQYVVLYFYPKDNTSGCTQEGLDFAAAFDGFAAHDCAILGLSRDSVKTHENFKAKQGFPFDLVADKEETACQLYHVIKPKKMYGKDVRGIERSTFLIDREGIIRREWRGVKVTGHVDAVLTALKELYQ